MPPTDNLYKFIAISGLIIYLFSINLAVTQFVSNRDTKFKLQNDSINILSDIKKDAIKMELLVAKYQFINGITIDDAKTILSKKDNWSFFMKDSISPKLYADYQLTAANKEKSKGKLKLVTYKIKDPKFYTDNSTIIATILFFLGAILVAFGFYNWYRKIHLPEMKLLHENASFSLESIKYNTQQGSWWKRLWNRIKNHFNKEHRVFLLFLGLFCLLLSSPLFILIWIISK